MLFSATEGPYTATAQQKNEARQKKRGQAEKAGTGNFLKVLSKDRKEQ